MVDRVRAAEVVAKELRKKHFEPLKKEGLTVYRGWDNFHFVYESAGIEDPYRSGGDGANANYIAMDRKTFTGKGRFGKEKYKTERLVTVIFNSKEPRNIDIVLESKAYENVATAFAEDWEKMTKGKATIIDVE